MILDSRAERGIISEDIFPTIDTPSPVLETRAHERRTDEEHGHARHDGREYLTQGLQEAGRGRGMGVDKMWINDQGAPLG